MKLEGLRVVDLSVFLPGPYLTMALADHGATVIKVEPPGGDPMRHVGPFDDGESIVFRNLNRGKQSIVLDLKDAGARATLLSLCESADVFVESFRPGVVARLGVDYATVRARNPRVVYCSISAFGQTGPYRDRPSHDLGIEAMAGMLGVGRDGAASLPGVPTADYVAALQALSGVLMALLRRETTGLGDYLDIGMHDAAISALANVTGDTFAGLPSAAPGLGRTTGGNAFYQLYATSDGRQIALAGSEPKFVRTLLNELGRPDLATLCEGPPGLEQEPVRAFLRAEFARRGLAEWVGRLGRLDICFAPVNSIAEAVDDENVHARAMVLRDAQGKSHLASPIRFVAEPGRPELQAPQLDQHREAILGLLAG